MADSDPLGQKPVFDAAYWRVRMDGEPTEEDWLGFSAWLAARPENRRAFVTKCAALLQQGVCVSIVDLVTTRDFNLYTELLSQVDRSDPAFSEHPPSTYAVTCRCRKIREIPKIEIWSYPLGRWPAATETSHLAVRRSERHARSRSQLRRDLPRSAHSVITACQSCSQFWV